jgi:hypothetical protein
MHVDELECEIYLGMKLKEAMDAGLVDRVQ